MLQLESPKYKYDRLEFHGALPEKQRRANSFAKVLKRLIPVSQVSLNDTATWDTHDVNELCLAEFLDTYEKRRNDLMYQKLMGENLEQAEAIELSFLNSRLDKLLDPPAPNAAA